jgi:hypothetical protein
VGAADHVGEERREKPPGAALGGGETQLGVAGLPQEAGDGVFREFGEFCGESFCHGR